MQRPMENPRSRWSPVLGPELAGCHSVSHCGPWESHESPGDWTRKFDDARWCKQQEWEYIYIYTYIYIYICIHGIHIYVYHIHIYIEYTALYTVYTWSIIIIHICVCVRWQHLYDVVSGWDKTYLSTTHERFLGCVLPRESHRGCSFVIPLILRAIGGTYHLYIYMAYARPKFQGTSP